MVADLSASSTVHSRVCALLTVVVRRRSPGKPQAVQTGAVESAELACLAAPAAPQDGARVIGSCLDEAGGQGKGEPHGGRGFTIGGTSDLMHGAGLDPAIGQMIVDICKAERPGPCLAVGGHRRGLVDAELRLTVFDTGNLLAQAV